MSKYTNEDIIEEFKNFDKDKMSLIVSTTNKENHPLTNYSPFVKRDDDYFICVSSNLPHFKNMVETNRAHILIIEDESKAGHIYGRKRLYFEATCTLENEEENIFKLFDERYGDSLSFLRKMKDFKVLKLSPKEKSLVLGFGAAYKMDEEGNLGQKAINHKSK